MTTPTCDHAFTMCVHNEGMHVMWHAACARRACDAPHFSFGELERAPYEAADYLNNGPRELLDEAEAEVRHQHES